MAGHRKRRLLGFVACTLLLAGPRLEPLVAQTPRGPYARIAMLHPRDGHTVDFEAGYVRHLAWHEQAHDTWSWYGWTVTFGERQRWFVYASFGHAAADFDSTVAPAEDERDNVLNVAPYVDAWSNALYEFLPSLSRGTGIPSPAARLELTTLDLNAGSASQFEAAVEKDQSTLQTETLWYRVIAGGAAPRYVRLRPRPDIAAIVDGRDESPLPGSVSSSIAKMSIEILTFRPTLGTKNREQNK